MVVGSGEGALARTALAGCLVLAVARFNADGSYAWTRTFPGSGNVQDLWGGGLFLNGLAATADGGVVAVGTYSGAIDLDPGTGVQLHQAMDVQGPEAFVVKLADDGSFVWGGTFAAQSLDSDSSASGVAIDGAGAVYVAGSFAGEVNFDLGAGAAVHSSRASNGEAAGAGALVKLTPAGQLSWVQSAETGACALAAASITVASDGAIWVLGDGGWTCSAASTSGAAGIATYGADGALRGYRELGDSLALTWPHAVAAGLNGSVYVGGGGWGLLDADPGPRVARQLLGATFSGGFIVKLGADGSYLWAQMLAEDQVFAVAGAPDGGVIGLAQYQAPIGKQADVLVTKLNADGTAGWTFSSGEIPGTVVSSATSFVVTGENGNFGSDMDPGPGVDTIAGGTLYLSRFDF